MKYAATIRPIKSPVSGKCRGWEFVVASVNRARFDIFSQDYVQSFARHYQIVSFPVLTNDSDKAISLLERRHPAVAKAELIWS
jgi:hypothetical protein